MVNLLNVFLNYTDKFERKKKYLHSKQTNETLKDSTCNK